MLTMRKAQELDVVELTQDLPEFSLKKGEIGAVVAAFDNPDEAYDLEFVDESGKSRFAYGVKPDQIVSLNAAAEDALRQGFRLFSRGQLHEAEAQLRKAVEMGPSAQVLGEVIQSFESPGQFQALPALRFLVRIAPGYGAAREVLAVAHMKYGVYQANQGEFELALDLFDGALGVAPPEEMVSRIRSDIAKAYTALGVSANEEGNSEKALTFMRSACEAELSVVSRYNLSLAYALFAEHFLTNRKFAEATEFFERAIDAGFSNAEVLNNYAIALLCRGDLEAAMVELERALSLDPQNEGIQANLIKARAFVPSDGDGVESVEQAEPQQNFSVLGMPNEFQRQPPMELDSYVAA